MYNLAWSTKTKWIILGRKQVSSKTSKQVCKNNISTVLDSHNLLAAKSDTIKIWWKANKFFLTSNFYHKWKSCYRQRYSFAKSSFSLNRGSSLNKWIDHLMFSSVCITKHILNLLTKKNNIDCKTLSRIRIKFTSSKP